MRAPITAARGWLGGEIARRFAADSFVLRSVAQVAGGTAVAQLVTVAVSPLLTRLYSPADFGVYAAATTVVTLTLVVSSLRYTTAIVIPADEHLAASLIVLSALTVVATTTILAVVLALFGPSLATALGAPALASVLWLVVVAEFGAAMYSIVSRWAVRARAFAELARTSVVQGIGLAAGQIGFGILVAGPAGLIIGDAIGRTAGTFRLGRRMWGAMRASFATVTRQSIWLAAVRYRRFPLISGPGAVLHTLNEVAPTMLLLALYGTTVGGQFALAQRIGHLPIRLLATSVGQVYAGQFTRTMNTDRRSGYSLLTRTIRTLAITSVAPIAGMAIAGPLLFPIVFGSEWGEAGFYLLFLAPTNFTQFLWHPVSGTLDMLERQIVGTLAEMAALALVVGVAVVTFAVGAGSAAAVLLLGLATALARITALVATFYETRRITRSLPDRESGAAR